MRTVVCRSAVLAGVLVAAFPLAGGRRGLIAQTRTSTPEFPSRVELITVDAVVLDGKGHPVAGLARDDFVVTEDGRPQEIASFEAVESQAAPAGTPAEPHEPAALATGRSPAAPGRAYAVLLDDVWIPPLDAPHVRAALTTFLDRTVRPGDHVSLATTSGALRWNADIPDGRDDLLAVVARFTGLGPAVDRGREVFVGEGGQLETMSEYQAHRIVKAMGTSPIAQEIEGRRLARMRLTHAALHREIDALSNVRGRKSLLLVTQGFIQDSGPELRETTRIAHHASVAIYFLDVRGVQGLLTTPGLSAEHGGAPDPSALASSIVEHDVHDTAGSQDLAADTGGFSVRNTNDLSIGMDRIADESRVFYLLGFHPPPGKPRGEWRKLRISVKRRGLTVRARPGYSLPPAGERARSDRPADAIPVRLASFVLEPVDADRTRVAVAMEVDVRGLPAADGPDAAGLVLRLEAIPRDGDRSYSHDVTLPRKATGDDTSGSPSTRLDFALRPDVYRVRAVVEDPATSRRGVVEQRVVVPGQDAFRISTPVLSDTPKHANDPASPVPEPVAHRSFSAVPRRPLLYAFTVFGAARDPATGRPDVGVGVTVRDRSGHVVIEAPDSAMAPSSSGRLEQVVGLPLAQMRAGDYTLELTVRDRVADKRVERRETFVVEAAPAVADLEGPASHPASPAPDLAPILERAGRYVMAYQKVFSDLVAEEDYRQRLERPWQWSRHSRADMVFVSLPGPVPWAVFRDIYEVDGKKVRDREARLERLFLESPGDPETAVAKAKAILDESARVNLGPVRRTINVPTFALLVLHPDNQHRFSFERAGTKAIEGTDTVEVAFAEWFRPTLVSGDGGDLAAKGSVWIDADRGTVLRTEIAHVSDGPDPSRRRLTRIVTDYERERRLQVTVPTRMTETYETPDPHYVDEAGRLVRRFVIKTVARYSRYRRFEVTTQEK